MREKLLKLLISAQDLITLSRKADFLIANDVVQVVRCKDCKYYADYGRVCDCIKYEGMNLPNDSDFCSYGERKEQ